MKMWLIPPKNPWVECVWEPWCARSVYYQPFSTALKHARTEALHARFHFFHGWAVTRENQTPPFPKCDPVHFTSGIKTFQWSQEGVLSPYKKATPMGRQTPPQKIKIKSVFGWCAGCTCDGNTSCFPYTSLWISFYSPNGLRCNHWHTPATPTLNVPTHTHFTVPQDASLTPNHFQEIVRAHVQIGRLMSRTSASGPAQRPPWLR